MANNPFPQPSPLEKVLLRELAEVAGHCYGRGWCPGTAGNFSLRGRGAVCWVSPSGVEKSSLSVASFVPVDIVTGKAVTPNAPSPSLEVAVHLALYRLCPDALVVVHAHPPHVVRATIGRTDLRFQGAEMQKAIGCDTHLEHLNMPILPNRIPSNFGEISQDIARLDLARVPFVILDGHGVYAWAASTQQALGYIEAVEFLCQTTL